MRFDGAYAFSPCRGVSLPEIGAFRKQRGIATNHPVPAQEEDGLGFPDGAYV